jgi:hypothetical protein
MSETTSIGMSETTSIGTSETTGMIMDTTTSEATGTTTIDTTTISETRSLSARAGGLVRTDSSVFELIGT